MTILTMAGINDPPVKLLMTGVNFFILYMLQLQEMLDPSETPRVQNVTADWRDVDLPLKGVLTLTPTLT